ncbi:MAG: hypothetical protein V2A58_08590 [Planctomycetota bacterium]
MTRRRRLLLIPLAVLCALFLASLIGASYFFEREFAPRAIASRLQPLLGVEPQIASARFNPLRGLFIRDFAFETRFEGGRVSFFAPRVEIYHIPRAFLNGQFVPEKVVVLDPVVEIRILPLELHPRPFHEIEGIDFARLGKDLRDSLLQAARLNPYVPSVEMRNASVRLREDSPANRVLDLEGVGLAISRSPDGILYVHADLSDRDLGSLLLTGSCDIPHARVDLDLSHKDVRLSPSLFQRLPDALAKDFLDARLAGKIDLRLHASVDASRPRDEDVLQLSGAAEVRGFSGRSSDAPYPVSDVSLDLDLAGGVLTVCRLTGIVDSELHPCPLSATGVIRLDQPRLDFAIDVVLENFYMDLRVLPLLLDFQRPMWSAANPEGLLRLDIRVVPPPHPETDPRLFYSGLMTVKDISFHARVGGDPSDPASEPREFLIPHLSGRIDASSAALRNGRLVGGEGDRRFEISGDIFDVNVRDGFYYDLRISAKHLDIAADVRPLLGRKDLVEACNEYPPEGLLDADLHFLKPKGGEPTTELDAQILRARVASTPFGIAIEGISGGSIHLDGRLLKVEDLAIDSPSCRVSAIVSTDPDAPAQTQLRISDLLIDDSLRRVALAIDEKVRKGEMSIPEGLSPLSLLWSQLNPRGRVDLDASFRKSPDAPQGDLNAALTIKGASLYLPLFSLPLSDITSGRIEYAGTTLHIRDVVAREGDTALTLRGELRNVVPGRLDAAEGSLILSAERVGLADVENLLVKASDILKGREDLSASLENLKSLWRQASPEGEIDVLTTLSKLPGADPLRSIDASADVKIRNARANLLGKFALANVAGAVYVSGRSPRTIDLRLPSGQTRTLEVPARSVRLANLVATHRDAALEINGLVSTAGDAPAFDLALKGQGLSIDADLLGLVQDPALLETLKKVNPVGRVALELDAKGVLEKDNPCVRISGRILLDAMSATMGMTFHDISAAVALSDAELRRGVFSASGRFTADRLAVRNQVVQGFSFDFSLHPSEKVPSAPEVSVANISGSFHGGSLAGNATVTLVPGTIRYNLDLGLSGVGMASFISSVLDYRREDWQGVLNGRILLRGEGADPENLVGSGELGLTQTSLWEQPLPLRIFELLNLSNPDRYAFTSAFIRFEFARKDLFLRELRFIGKGLSVHGRGWIRDWSLLDLAFVPGRGSETLSPALIEPLKQELISIRIKGNLNDFETRIDLFPALSAPITDLLDAVLGRE